MKPLIYIAGPFSTEQERESLKHMIELVKKKYDADLYIPMEYKVEGDYQKDDGSWNLPNEDWAKKVFAHDLDKLTLCDKVIAMYTGRQQSQSGTSWEIGYAYAEHIPITIYIPDWAKNNPMSLMVINSAEDFMLENGDIVLNVLDLNQK